MISGIKYDLSLIFITSSKRTATNVGKDAEKLKPSHSASGM